MQSVLSIAGLHTNTAARPLNPNKMRLIWSLETEVQPGNSSEATNLQTVHRHLPMKGDWN